MGQLHRHSCAFTLYGTLSHLSTCLFVDAMCLQLHNLFTNMCSRCITTGNFSCRYGWGVAGIRLSPSSSTIPEYGFKEDPEKPGTHAPFLPIVLTICPITFVEEDDGDGGGQSNLAGIQPTVGTGLDEYSSQGMTLFHELFHLVLGGAFTPDNGKL